MTTSNEHNNAPAVPQGWKLVPVEPTRAMWAAVNKLDDEMAAGSYDGKGCSIEQAWNCMLDFAPDAPALAATQAPAPAQESGESVQLRGLDDSSAMLRVRTILESKACYLAGSTIAEIVAAAQPAQEVGLTDEAVNDAAKVLAERFDYPWEHMPEEGRKNMRTQARAVVIAALRAKGGKL